MKKLALTALAAAMAVVGLASTASAASRNGDDEWRRHGSRDSGDMDRRGDNRRDEWRHGDRRHHWHNRHHRPRFAHRRYFRDDVCFVKKIRVYDDWGNLHVKRVRVCR
ncbi:MAG: hypothetical protein KL863_13460 [Rhizobium sp.]|nr:hypothetical protein [Rhizobium sp.]